MTRSSKKKARLVGMAALLAAWRFFEEPVPGSHGIFPGVPLEIASSYCIYGL